MKPSVLIIVAAIIALAFGIAARHGGLSTLSLTPVAALPEFAFPDLDGRQRSVAEWQGKILVINFWATWCPPCREEIPDLIDLQQQYSGQGLQIVGIAVEELETVSKFAGHMKINYPLLIAGDQGLALAQQLGNFVGAVPYTVVVDRQGQIIHRQPGQMSKQALLEIFEPMLK